MTTTFLRNPHLAGDAFFWQAEISRGVYTEQSERARNGALLIHGFTATTAEVRLLGEYLHARGYTVSAPLLPGHGTTPDGMNRCAWQDWTRAVDDAYAQLTATCERIFVLGESMGALLALFLASGHPEIGGVVCYAPALLTSTSRMWQARVIAPLIPYAKKPIRAPSDAYARWKGYTVNPLRAVVQLSKLQKEIRRRLPRVHQPILVIQGRFDQAIDPCSGQVLLAEVSSREKELIWLEHSTHCVILDREWEQAAELTAKFIERK
jgi:carboxylesterase